MANPIGPGGPRKKYHCWPALPFLLDFASFLAEESKALLHRDYFTSMLVEVVLLQKEKAPQSRDDTREALPDVSALESECPLVSRH